MSININLTGGTYKRKSLQLSAQVTRNFWPQIQDKTAKSPYVLESFPGKKLFGTVTGSRARGMLEHLDTLYRVVDTTLYSVDTAGTHTSLGTIPGVSKCIIVGIGSNIVISTESTRYYWNGSAVSTISDGDLEAGNSAAHLNNQILFDGTGGRFAVSDVGGATSISGLNYATAESNADNLVRIYVHDQLAYMMGDKTIEPWWNSGVGIPPFDRVEGSISQVGLGAVYAVANTKQAVYFLGNDNLLYALKGSQCEPVLNDALSAQFAGFNFISDAEMIAYCLSGQWLVEVSFPTQDKTFCYVESTGDTFELSSGTQGGRNIASTYAFFARKHLVGDSTSGNLYELDVDTYTENGETIVRLRDSAPLHGGLFGAPGKMLTMTRFELIMEKGVGLLTGQGVDPEIMLSFSDDGGHSFSTEMTATVGRIGQFQHKVEWFALGSFYERIIRIRVSDPVHWSIHAVSADIEIGI